MRLPPPITYLVAVIVGALVHAYALPLHLDFALGARMGAGVAVAGLGIATMVGAMGLFKRTGQDPKPWKSTPEIISTGVYRVTRNPLYGGRAWLPSGIGNGLANGWILVLAPPGHTLI